jgi:hypothetical protein
MIVRERYQGFESSMFTPVMVSMNLINAAVMPEKIDIVLMTFPASSQMISPYETGSYSRICHRVTCSGNGLTFGSFEGKGSMGRACGSSFMPRNYGFSLRVANVKTSFLLDQTLAANQTYYGMLFRSTIPSALSLLPCARTSRTGRVPSRSRQMV